MELETDPKLGLLVIICKNHSGLREIATIIFVNFYIITYGAIKLGLIVMICNNND